MDIVDHRWWPANHIQRPETSLRYFSPTAVNVTPLLLRRTVFPQKVLRAGYLMADRRGGNIEILCGQIKAAGSDDFNKSPILRKEGIGRFIG